MSMGSAPVLELVAPLPDVVQIHDVTQLRSAATQTAVCVCGHAQDAHEHYRRGSDCALCDCPRYRRGR